MNARKLARLLCTTISSAACMATAAEKVVSQETMKAIYEEVKTPYKVGMVLLPEKGECLDDPAVFRHGDTWYMTVVRYVNKGYETHLAKSADLVHWQRLGCTLKRGEPGTWDSAQAGGYPCLFDTKWGGSNELKTFDGKYWMIYLGGDRRGYEAEPLSNGMAWSRDPTVLLGWQRYAKNPVLRPSDPDARAFERATLYKHFVLEDTSRFCGGRFVSFYNGKQKGVWREMIGIAVSDDMLKWRRVGDGPLLDNGSPDKRGLTANAMLQKIDDVWVMFYFGYLWRPGGAFDTFACSYDLKNWTKWEGKPLLEPTEPYDKTHAHKPWVLKHDGVVYHFYCAVGDKGRGIALATSKPIR